MTGFGICIALYHGVNKILATVRLPERKEGVYAWRLLLTMRQHIVNDEVRMFGKLLGCTSNQQNDKRPGKLCSTLTLLPERILSEKLISLKWHMVFMPCTDNGWLHHCVG